MSGIRLLSRGGRGRFLLGFLLHRLLLLRLRRSLRERRLRRRILRLVTSVHLRRFCDFCNHGVHFVLNLRRFGARGLRRPRPCFRVALFEARFVKALGRSRGGDRFRSRCGFRGGFHGWRMFWRLIHLLRRLSRLLRLSHGLGLRLLATLAPPLLRDLSSVLFDSLLHARGKAVLLALVHALVMRLCAGTAFTGGAERGHHAVHLIAEGSTRGGHSSNQNAEKQNHRGETTTPTPP